MFYAMRTLAFFAILPLVLSLQLLHFPTPQDTLDLAESLIYSGRAHVGGYAAEADMGHANDMRLSAIGDEHVVLSHKKYPNHKVRIKSTTGWCDPDVKSYSGFLDVGYGKNLFFYFFESRSKPSQDPVIMWINGGPGCSSSLGMLMELGPCSVKDDPKGVNDTERNPYAWNEKANVFFLDEPIGVGFSHADNGQTVSTTEEAAIDVQAFISIFFETFKEFEGRAFHMAGESYGGRYLPVFASAVVDGNKQLIKEGMAPINLNSVMIGNGVTDYFTTTESYFPFQCTLHGDLTEPVQSIGACVAMAEAVPKCHKLAKRGCLETHDYTTCSMAINYCEEVLGETFLSAGVNPYDVTMPCTVEELADSLCYPVTKKIGTYLDLPDVRHTLGVDKLRSNWSSCDGSVFTRFTQSLDNTGKTWLYVAGLLERGVRVLNYVGMLDFICNHVANELWMERLEWSGRAGYNVAEFNDWIVDGHRAGEFKTYGNLTMLKIRGAGHMVPYDKPKEALFMVTSWLDAAALDQ
ncbi:cathepsin A (carboxypeptidase C) [Cryptococcus neoformans C23]|uniref:Carboxypeptidase n=1 Tax=Cryptococcus neoformans (strain H99 / ATCC 208821 / CBS 10515 / FGSC 9487) TaxID=235443 RepID=J9W1U6_CRYN9|nr:cathepsin A (carboxypeptidase C) [Cryptococcus neoformans var. grubii H99]AUB28176.1 cathepsin A (carboxypeptidase C) [Cryptococcus neoformans var. grubii]OWZ33887.1 cathepsin A (carboxypeptidase C) [Cryptococcus neoformans var. grubii AD2-60a]OWZ46015.1 cathepsin A (carboxypeptidase C) [Cryptococcus neoformans var. grubii C23]OXC81759.1 cathepsin A (carboxypeptidase C) [Cryptococcus neoformans var. grubii AD1-7a]OXG73537.1 cathepsin A (carboxypeptidase C) [Cryptococcus neoformans var. grub|eukprot:XP_012052822.1 cathepsin A (carboxypeptidase C) [Cryptococcus neoformans var. grubii H99]